jgi:hypothetical protein
VADPEKEKHCMMQMRVAIKEMVKDFGSRKEYTYPPLWGKKFV